MLSFDCCFAHNLRFSVLVIYKRILSKQYANVYEVIFGGFQY